MSRPHPGLLLGVLHSQNWHHSVTQHRTWHHPWFLPIPNLPHQLIPNNSRVNSGVNSGVNSREMFFKHFSPPQPFSIPAALSQLLSLPAVASYCFSSPFSPCSQSEVMALKCWSVPITPLQFPPTGLRKRSKLLSVTTHYEHNTRHFSLYLAPFCSFLSHCSPLCLQI